MVIFCIHAVETLTYFSRQMAESFAAWGYDVFYLDFSCLEKSAAKMRRAAAGCQAALITFNCIGLSGEDALWSGTDESGMGLRIWEELDIRCLNILVDHPVYYYKPFLMPVKTMRVFCIDWDHAAYMRRFYPSIPCAFLPVAGNRLLDSDLDSDKKEAHPAAEAGFSAWEKRPYPIVFTANYVPVGNIEAQLDALEPEYRDFYYEMIYAFVEYPEQNLLSVAEYYLKREMPEITDVELCSAMQTLPAVDLWVRTYFREKTVQALADGGIPVYLVGKDWEKMPCRHPQFLHYNGEMADSAFCVRAMSQAKISLNVMPWFKAGAHDRIFTAMLQNSVALTDGSSYLREQFADGDTLVYYSLAHLEALPQLAERLLREPERLYGIACRGRACAEKEHTWARRAEVLRGYME